MEAGIFAWERYEELAERAEQEAHAQETILGGPMGYIETIIDNPPRHEAAMKRAEKMRTAQEAETAILGGTFSRDADQANAFSKLSRYETAIERGLYKALHELERRQGARQGGHVPAPVAVDVDVSGIPEGDR